MRIDPVPFKHPWQEAPLSGSAIVTVGGTPSTSVPSYWNGSVKWMASGDIHKKRIADVDGRITEMGLRCSAACIVEPPAVAIALAGQGKTRGTVALLETPLCTNQSVAIIKTDERTLSDKYLYHNLDLRYEELRSRSSGGGRAGLTKSIIEALPIPFPRYEEQTAIAKVLDTVDNSIRQTVALIEKLKKIKTGLLHDLLTRGIDESGQLRDPVRHPEQFKDSPLGKVPKAWDICSLMQYVAFPTGQVDPRLMPYNQWPLIAPDHIESGTGRLLYTVSAKEQNAISGKYAFEPGDVLYSKIRPYLRKATLATGRGLCSADMYPLRPSERLTSGFLLMLLLGESFSRFAESVSMRSGFPKINRQEMASYRLALPQIEEQAEQQEAFNALQNRLLTEESTLCKLTMMKQGLMQDLLRGRVRVPVAIAAEHERKTVAAAKEKKGHEANIYFKRSVLAAEIVSQMHKSPTFGHVKFMKTLYLVEQLAQVALQGHYHRAAAGPLDNRMIRSVDSQMEKSKWFRAVLREHTDGKPGGYTYEAMEKAGGHREWFEKYWEGARAKIQSVIDILQRLDTQQCEIIATLYSAWADMLSAGRAVTDDAIITEVLTNWHESKQAIPHDRWSKALGWMRMKELVPIMGGGE